LGHHAALTGHGLLTAFCDVAEHIVLAQLVDALCKVRGRPELLFRDLGLAKQLCLLDELGEENVPSTNRHDQEQNQHAVRDKVAGCHKRL
jgi:hypothetical protein